MKDRLDRMAGVVKKTNKIADIAGIENPEELLKRYINTIDSAIMNMRELRLELTRNLRGYQNAGKSKNRGRKGKT